MIKEEKKIISIGHQSFEVLDPKIWNASPGQPELNEIIQFLKTDRKAIRKYCKQLSIFSSLYTHSLLF